MKKVVNIIFFLSTLVASAQIANLPVTKEADGVSKTVVNPKLFPLLLKVNTSESTENAAFYKNFIANLSHFEIYVAENEVAAGTLSSKFNTFLKTNKFNELQTNVYQKTGVAQQEFVVVISDSASLPRVYAFTTKPSFNDIKRISLLLDQKL